MSDTKPEHGEANSDTREQILMAAARLIAQGGPDAATTRAVATAAGVQPPIIYRIFGDKRGLLEAVAEREMTAYVGRKAARASHPDPLEDLREGWDSFIAFNLDNPGLFAIFSGDPLSSSSSAAVQAGKDILRQRIRRLARAGQLTTTEDRAVALMHSVGMGTVSALLGQTEEARDLGLSDFAREAVLGAVASVPQPARGLQAIASQLMAALQESKVLTPGEHHLLLELLTRIAASEQ